ncbi:MAG: hypothetical protein V4661_15535 [Pseudomonadota bacterium]
MFGSDSTIAGQADAADRPYFAQFGDLADEAERTAEAIESFIDRCRGSGGAKSASVSPVPSGHFGQLDRLKYALAEANKLARELQTIG